MCQFTDRCLRSRALTLAVLLHARAVLPVIRLFLSYTNCGNRYSSTGNWVLVVPPKPPGDADLYVCVILLCSPAFDVPVRRSASGIGLLLVPEAGGQTGDHYPDRELHTALSSLTLLSPTPGHRRTNQMQEPPIDHTAFHLLT